MVIVTTVAILIAAGCGPEKTPPPMVVAAGDIADCAREGDEATARLLGGIEGTVLTLGDHAYPDGSAENFDECYDPTWGQFKDRTRPSPGNHEYETGEAQGYFGFFGKAAGDPDEGYYSYDLGAWHIVALNSNCGEGEIRCGPGSPRGGGFRRTSPPTTRRRVPLPTSTTRCSLRGRIVPALNGWSVFGRFSTPPASTWCSTATTTTTSVLPRRIPGRADPEGGIREFVVGTGGRSLYEISQPIANTEVYSDEAYGVLKLTLHPKKYEWEFVPVKGETFSDSGVARCH